MDFDRKCWNWSDNGQLLFVALQYSCYGYYIMAQVKSLEGDLRKSQRLLEDLREKTKLEEVSYCLKLLEAVLYTG